MTKIRQPRIVKHDHGEGECSYRLSLLWYRNWDVHLGFSGYADGGALAPELGGRWMKARRGGTLAPVAVGVIHAS